MGWFSWFLAGFLTCLVLALVMAILSWPRS